MAKPKTPAKPRTKCKHCGDPMPPKEGKDYCKDTCRYAHHRNPFSEAKIRREIKRIERDVRLGIRRTIRETVLDVLRELKVIPGE